MSSPNSSTTSTGTSTSTPVTETSTATSATGAPQGEAAAGFNASTPVSSIEDLKSKAPTVYKAMMEGIAMNIVNEIKDHQQRLKEMQRKAQRDAEGKS